MKFKNNLSTLANTYIIKESLIMTQFDSENFYKWLSKENNFLVLKETIFKNSTELKQGKKFGLVLTNLKTSKTWISSTNNPEQREKDLKYYLKNKKLWNGPWRDIFGDLNDIDILSNIDFSVISIPDLTINELTNSIFNKELVNDNFKREFITLVRKYATEKQFNNILQKEIGQKIFSFFDNLKDKHSIKIIDIILLVDK